MTREHSQPPFVLTPPQRLMLALLRDHETHRKAGRPWPRRGWQRSALRALDMVAKWHARVTALLGRSSAEVQR